MLRVMSMLAVFAVVVIAMATWTGTCEPCVRNDHLHCKGTSRNPCDCAANGHKNN